MRTLSLLLISIIGGLFLGLLLSEIIGILGYLLLGRAVGIRFLPVLLALVAAGGVLISRRRKREEVNKDEKRVDWLYRLQYSLMGNHDLVWCYLV